jgi:hypothetical protein
MNEDIESLLDTKRTTQNAYCSRKRNQMKSIFENPFNALHTRPRCHIHSVCKKITLTCEYRYFLYPGCVICNLLGCEHVISFSALSVCDSTGQGECQTLLPEHLNNLQESHNDHTPLQYIIFFSQIGG